MKSNIVLWSLTFDTSPEAVDTLTDALGDDPLSLSSFAPPRSKSAKVEAIYGAEPDRATTTAHLAVASMVAGVRLPKITIQQVPKLDWLKKVAADFPPLPIGRWTVHGAQHRAAVPDRRRALQIDATSAFGTGEHPTTRGCLLALEWVMKRGFRGTHMLDMGCGSGILAMAWAQVQRKSRAIGVDMDADSISVARDNLHTNGLQSKIHVAVGRGYTGLVRRNAPYDVIMANIFARPLAHMAKNLKHALRPGGVAILSGLLTHQINLVLAAHRMQGLYPVRIFRLGEWAVICLQRQNFE